MSTSAGATSTRSRKVRAILAGGVVLGVGAAVTLAAWTDQEWAVGEFGAGSFDIEGSTDGTDFTDHASQDGAATLGFEVGADNLAPGDTVAAPFVLRTDATTTYDATVTLTTAIGEGDNAANLSYGITQVATAADCVEGATGAAIVPEGTSLDSVAGASEFTLTSGDGAAGTPVALCFQVTAGPDLVQGAPGIASWELTATSVE